MNVIKSFLIFVVSGTGRGKKATGRPPAEPEDRSYSELNEEGMRKYNKLKKQEQRSRDTTPSGYSRKFVGHSAKSCRNTKTAAKSSTPPRKVGRPPLNEKAMTPKTLNARKLHLYEKSVQSSKKLETAKKQWMRSRTKENVTNDESNIDLTSDSTTA